MKALWIVLLLLLPLSMIAADDEESEGDEKILKTIKKIQEEAEQNPDLLHEAPHTQPVRRLDEVRAARELDLRWTADG